MKLLLRCVAVAALIFAGLSAAADPVEVDGILYDLFDKNSPISGVKCLGPKENHATFTRNNLTIASQVTIDGALLNVTSIVEGAFKDCVKITGNLVLPETVRSIGRQAFQNCSGLTGVLDLSKLKTLSGNIFEGCSGFNQLILGDNITGIPVDAFSGCSGFQGELDLSNVNNIDGRAFKNCSGFSSLKLSEDYAGHIGIYAFQNCTGFKGDLVIPDGVKTIGNYAFDGCSGFDGVLKFGEGPKAIEEYAFRDCSGFTGSLDLSNVSRIGQYAFQNCKGFTGDLVIPNSIESLGSGVFRGCSGFNGKLDLTNLNEKITHLSHYLFRECSGLTGDIVIPNTVTDIFMAVFMDCTGFDGELKLGENTQEIDAWAFRGCTGLKGTLTIPASMKKFGEDTNNTVYAWAAFRDCKGFTAVKFLGDEVNYIPEELFMNCEGLTGEIVLPNLTDEIKKIDHHAFSGCKNITNVRLDDNITAICEEAFSGCESLETLKLPNSIKELESRAFYGCSSLKMDLIIPETITKLGTECFSKSGLTGVVVPAELNGKCSFGSGAFANIDNLNWAISLSDEPSSETLGLSMDTPLYVHSQVVDAYKEAMPGYDQVFPILAVDDLELYENNSAKITYEYQPELSDETSEAIQALSPGYKGTAITWSCSTIDESLEAQDELLVDVGDGEDSPVVSFDPESLTVRALKAGTATVTANDGVNIATAMVSVSRSVGVEDVVTDVETMTVNGLTFPVDRLAEIVVSVCDVAGRMVYTRVYGAGAGLDDVVGLAPGSYIVNVISGVYNTSAKLAVR
ncbi:MAG: leucine-rich repeat domain-containing protein [Muribaculaceae bacterium]|nr:leucine-rich repeat domain-containing protein [Muribaculaceae bacterium]